MAKSLVHNVGRHPTSRWCPGLLDGRTTSRINKGNETKNEPKATCRKSSGDEDNEKTTLLGNANQKRRRERTPAPEIQASETPKGNSGWTPPRESDYFTEEELEVEFDEDFMPSFEFSES